MANTKSAEKRNRQSLKRRARNMAVRTQLKTAVKKVREVVAQEPAKSVEALKSATRTIARAASKGVIHKRAASRRISRLAKAAHKATQSAR